MHLCIVHRSYFIAKTRFKKRYFCTAPPKKTDIKSHLHIQKKNEPRYSQQKSPRFSEISQEAE